MSNTTERRQNAQERYTITMLALHVEDEGPFYGPNSYAGFLPEQVEEYRKCEGWLYQVVKQAHEPFGLRLLHDCGCFSRKHITTAAWNLVDVGHLKFDDENRLVIV